MGDEDIIPPQPNLPHDGDNTPTTNTNDLQGSFFKKINAADTTSLEKPGDEIGPYKLLTQIGEGGFGTVWMAERRKPFVQRVALKIIKAGMDSKNVLARFDQERQALALMNHPNIAKVLDGGLTPAGRPYFAMEYVKGEPITNFCDNRKLSLKDRLQLFTQVCDAIQHAHTKGIIHRDLKPGNILVTSGEGDTAQAKVIDFGVAKALTQAHDVAPDARWQIARQQQVAVRQDDADSPVEIELLQVDDTVGDASGNAVGATGKANGVAEAPTTT